MLEHLPLIVFLVTFVLIFVLRMPIPAGMIAACTLYFLTDGLIKGVGFGALITGAGGSLHLVAQKTIEAIFTNGTIVAVPLFIFAANVMNAGKITEYVFGTCMGLVGRFRGGLAHVNVLASLVFSGMTGSAIADATDLPVKGYNSGPLGGDQQIGAKIVEGRIDLVIFFSDPLTAQPHDPDVKALLRIAQVYDIPIANNRATADFILQSKLMNEEYEHTVINFSKNIQTRAKELK